MKSKKLPKYVTHTMLAKFAQAADQTFAIKIAAMEERLRDEFGASRIVAAVDEESTWPGLHGPEEFPAITYEGNELAPKAGE